MKIKSSHKISVLTCCYCGARSTLPPGTAQRLVCHGCGAPIRKIEAAQPVLEKRRKKTRHPKAAVPHPAEAPGRHADKDRPARRRKGKRKKQGGLWYHVSEAFDDLDDLFDFDIFD